MGYYAGEAPKIIETGEIWRGSPVYTFDGISKFAFVHGQCLAVPTDYDLALQELDHEFPGIRS